MSKTTPQNRKLKARIVTFTALTENDKARMFELMQRYYDAVSHEQFLKDLMKKDDVILLLDEADQQICGFSTLVCISIQHRGKPTYGIFSGDTVIEKDYWGQRALGKAFLRYLFVKKVQRPHTPLYWLLITKGYKTYLMMANNFVEYYPRFDNPTPPDKQELMRIFYSQLYPDEYNTERGVVIPASEACHLKAGIAAISENLLHTNPKIAFFQQANPDWQKGAELACLARMTLWMPLQYALKTFVIDRLLKPFRSFQSSLSGLLTRKEKKTDER